MNSDHDGRDEGEQGFSLERVQAEIRRRVGARRLGPPFPRTEPRPVLRPTSYGLVIGRWVGDLAQAWPGSAASGGMKGRLAWVVGWGVRAVARFLMTRQAAFNRLVLSTLGHLDRQDEDLAARVLKLEGAVAALQARCAQLEGTPSKRAG